MAKALPRLHQILGGLSPNLISMQVYNPRCGRQFDQEKLFEKWAAVLHRQQRPRREWNGTKLRGGEYAVIAHR